MPKSYELKLREAEERRRKPEQQDTIYKAIEGKSQKSLDLQGDHEVIHIIHYITHIIYRI